MNRRQFGLGVGCVLVGSVAGCVGQPDQPPEGDQRDGGTNTSNTRQLVERDPSVVNRDVNTAPQIQDFPGRETLSDDATATAFVQFGASDDAHQVILLADSSSPLETTVTIRRTNATPFYNETVTLSNEAYAVYEFQQYSEYVIEISTAQHSDTKDVDANLIDCNDSHQFIQLVEGGSIEEATDSTMMGCL